MVDSYFQIAIGSFLGQAREHAAQGDADQDRRGAGGKQVYFTGDDPGGIKGELRGSDLRFCRTLRCSAA